MLNSDFVQFLLKLAFSKAGVAIRWIVGYAMGALLAKNIIPSGDASGIQEGLVSGLTALAAIGYAGLNFWINARRQKGVQVVQHMVGTDTSGVVGNNTIKAVADLTGKNPHVAIAAINSTH